MFTLCDLCCDNGALERMKLGTYVIVTPIDLAFSLLLDIHLMAGADREIQLARSSSLTCHLYLRQLPRPAEDKARPRKGGVESKNVLAAAGSPVRGKTADKWAGHTLLLAIAQDLFNHSGHVE